MIFLATLYKENAILRQEKFAINTEVNQLNMADTLELVIRYFCRIFDLSHPLWLDKNTREWGSYSQTQFFASQFMEDVNFDRFHLEQIN